MIFYLTNSLKPCSVQFIIIYDKESHQIVVFVKLA